MIIQIFVFLLTVIFSPSLGPGFLEPTTKTLVSFGAKEPYSMRYSFQIWRFFIPIFLHGSLMHLFGNMVSQAIFAVALESTLGVKSMAFLYMGSGFGGYLLSALASNGVSVGASGAIMGVLMCYFSYFLVNWQALEGLGTMRYSFLCIIGFMVLLNMIAGGSSVDTYGHLGGLVTGFLLGLVVVEEISHLQSENHRKRRVYCMFLIGGLGIIGLLGFYTARNPPPLY